METGTLHDDYVRPWKEADENPHWKPKSFWLSVLGGGVLDGGEFGSDF